MFAVGQLVRILPPFGDGERVEAIMAVQHVNAAGEIVAEPSVGVQYQVYDGTAYAPQWLELAE